LTAAELTALIISGLSLLIALLALYRVELRGPSVRLRLLEVSKWSLSALWLNYITDEEGRSFPDRTKACRLQVSARFSLIIENTGSRTGALYGVTAIFKGLPDGFDILPKRFEDTHTIDGKSTVALGPEVTLDRSFDTATEALAIYRKIGPDPTVRFEYQASRPLGRIARNSDEIAISRQALIGPVDAWAKNLD
jgi:hypothetical protein